MGAHVPSVMAGGGCAWATCSCGWGSVEYRTARGASAAWAEHIATDTHPPAPRLRVPEPESEQEA